MRTISIRPMRPTLLAIAVGAAVAASDPAPAAWPGDPGKCAADAVKVGATCVDKYEASVWQIPAALLSTGTGASLVAKIQRGKATLDDLTDAGAIQLGCTSAAFGHRPYPGAFPADGNWLPVAGTTPPSPGVYAVSIPGVVPSACTTWFQAEQACALSNKRLIRNQEWQRAAAGTPDAGAADDGTTDCNTGSPSTVALAGARAGCVSAWGARDMVGNLGEWTGDWIPGAGACSAGNWSTLTGFGVGDTLCPIPNALHRGGVVASGDGAGVFAGGSSRPDSSFEEVGFRCAR